MIAFYAYELILTDEAKREARIAPDSRLHSLLSRNPATFAFLKGRPGARKIVAVALEVEKWTAPLRRDDDLLRRYGLEEMTTALERRTQKEIPHTSGRFGKTVSVSPRPDWVPKFAAPETYDPMQSAVIRDNLLRPIQ